MSDAAPRRTGWLAPLLLVLVTLLLHAPSLGQPLLHDDRALITDNPALWSARKGPAPLLPLVTGDALSPVRPDGPDAPDLSAQALYRPVTLLAWAGALRVAHHVAAGGAADGAAVPDTPSWPFHLLSLVAHALVVLLLWRVVARLFGSAWIATLAALLFAVHPLPVAATAHAAALGTLLSTAAVLAGLLCWRGATDAPGRLRPLAFAGLLVALFAGLLCHEQALLLLPLVALADWATRRPAAGAAAGAPASGAAPAGHPAVYAGLLVVLAAAVLLRSLALGHLHPDIAAFDPIANPLAAEPAAVRLLNAPSLVALPLRLLLAPLRFSADYSFDALPVVRAATAPAVIADLATVAALLLGGLPLRRRSPALAFGLLGFLGVALAGSSALLPLGAIWGEARAYLPAAFGCVAIGAVLDAVGRRLRLAEHRGRAWAGLAVLLLAGGALAARTLLHEGDYQSSLALYEAAEAVVPRSARVHERLGALLASEHRYADAAAQDEAALAIAPDSVPAALGLADALAAQGRAQEALAACDRLVASTQRGAERAPPEARRTQQALLRLALTRRARARLGRGDPAGAEADWRVAVTLPGGGTEPQMRLARLLQQSGRAAQAVPLLRDALAEDPDNPEALYELARADFAAGDVEGGTRVLDKLQQTPRGQAFALQLQAMSLRAEGLAARDVDKLAQADAMFDRVRELDSELPAPWFVSGRRHFEAGRYADALPDLLAAIERAPHDGDTLSLLARTQNALDQPEAALETVQRLAVLDAGSPTLAIMAEAHLRLSRLDDLSRDCVQLDALGFDPVEIVLGRAGALHAELRFDDAVAVLQFGRRVPGYGGDPRLLRAEAEVQLDAGRPTEALAALAAEEALQKEKPQGPQDAVLPFNRARALTLLHREMEAAAQLEQAEPAAPADSPLRPLLLQRRAELFLSAGGPFFDPAEAERLCAEALTTGNHDAARDEELLTVLIEAALAVGDLPGATARAADIAARYPDAPRWKTATLALQRAREGDRIGAFALLLDGHDPLLARIAARYDVMGKK